MTTVYPVSRPTVDEVTMCTVTEFNENAGLRVSVDEYGLDGFLMLSELHNKKIRGPISNFLKVGTQLPLSVVDQGKGDGAVFLSKKDVKEQQVKECKTRYQLNNKLVALAKRLPGDTEQWLSTFREINSPDHLEEEHPWTLIQHRDLDELGLSEEQCQIIMANHAKLFGIKPQCLRAQFTVYSFAIDGNQRVKDALIGILNRWNRPPNGADETEKVWTAEDLYEDNTRCNLTMLPIGLPTFQLKVSAYNHERCHEVYSAIKQEITEAGLDHCIFNDPVREN
jgi:translation initiation factor 2 alpha subunit (eIF-2alpha)